MVGRARAQPVGYATSYRRDEYNVATDIITFRIGWFHSQDGLLDYGKYIGAIKPL